jgi:hypothetical protein
LKSIKNHKKALLLKKAETPKFESGILLFNLLLKIFEISVEKYLKKTFSAKILHCIPEYPVFSTRYQP